MCVIFLLRFFLIEMGKGRKSAEFIIFEKKK